MNKAEWRAANPERHREYSRRDREKVRNDPERRARKNAATRAWRQSRIASDAGFREREYERRKGRSATPTKWAKATAAAIRIRSAAEGVACDLSAEWLLSAIPAECPIFRQPLIFGKRSPLNASVDRLIPDGGYTMDNVRVISHEANLIKRRCADPEVFMRLAEWLRAELAQRLVGESHFEDMHERRPAEWLSRSRRTPRSNGRVMLSTATAYALPGFLGALG